MKIAKIIEEKQEEEKEIRTMEKIVSRRSHRYFKVFEKKELKECINKEDMGSCYKSQKRICSKKGKDISIIQNKERESTEVLEKSVKKGVYLTIEIITNVTSILCTKEKWYRIIDI